MNTVEGNEKPQKSTSSAELAAGLIYEQRYFLIPATALICIIPAWREYIYALTNPRLFLQLEILAQIIELACFYILLRRVAKSFGSSKSTASSLAGLPIFLVLGLTHWFFGSATVILAPQFEGLSPFSLVMRLAAAGAGLGIWYAFFFFFTPFLLGNFSLKNLVLIPWQLIRRHPFAPLGILLPAFIVELLISAIVTLPYPDGRSAFLSSAQSLGHTAGWLVGSVLAIANCFNLLPEDIWTQNNFTGYRKERLATLAMVSPDAVRSIMRASQSWVLAVTCLLLTAAQLSRIPNLPPAAAIELKSASGDEHFITITIEVHDPEYSLRGFRPVFFRLASRKGTPASEPLSSANRLNSDEDLRYALPLTSDKVNLILKFKTTEPAAKVLDYKDLYLWYGANAIVQVP